jgi:hypothetical protein
MRYRLPVFESMVSKVLSFSYWAELLGGEHSRRRARGLALGSFEDHTSCRAMRMDSAEKAVNSHIYPPNNLCGLLHDKQRDAILLFIEASSH